MAWHELEDGGDGTHRRIHDSGALDDVHGVNDVASALGHLLALCVTHDWMQPHILHATDTHSWCVVPTSRLRHILPTLNGETPVSSVHTIAMRATQKNRMS